MNAVNSVKQCLSNTREVIVGTFKNLFFPLSYFQNLTNDGGNKLRSLSAIQLNRFGSRKFTALNPQFFTENQIQQFKTTKLVYLKSVGNLEAILVKLSESQILEIFRITQDLPDNLVLKISPEKILYLIGNNRTYPHLRINERIVKQFACLASRNQNQWENIFLDIYRKINLGSEDNEKATQLLMSTSSPPSTKFLAEPNTRHFLIRFLMEGNHNHPLFRKISFKFYLQMIDEIMNSRLTNKDKALTSLAAAARACAGFNKELKKQTLKNWIAFFTKEKYSRETKEVTLNHLKKYFKSRYLLYTSLINSPKLPKDRSALIEELKDLIFQKNYPPYKVIPLGSYLTIPKNLNDQSLSFLKELGIKEIEKLNKTLKDAASFIEEKLKIKPYKELADDDKGKIDAKLELLNKCLIVCDKTVIYLTDLDALLTKTAPKIQIPYEKRVKNYITSLFSVSVELKNKLQGFSKELLKYKSILNKNKDASLKNREAEEDDLDIYQYTALGDIFYDVNGNWKKILQIDRLEVLKKLDIVESKKFKEKYKAAFPEDSIPVGLSGAKRVKRLRKYLDFCKKEWPSLFHS